MKRPPRIMFSAGEPSGDLHAAGVLAELRARLPDLAARGLGGDRLAEAGAELDLEYGELALIGLGGVLGKLRRIRQTQRMLERAFADVDALICVDYGGFNKGLARRAARRGLPVIYYICPKVWVWGAWRAAGLARSCELMLPILPFEEPLWRQQGVPTLYVGNPVLDYLPAPREPGDPERVAVLPGSREGELRRLLPVFEAAARLLRARRPGLRFVIPSATAAIHELTARWLAELDIEILEHVAGDLHGTIQNCGLALTASGTVGLEVACLGVPQLICYRVDPLTELFARTVIRTRWVGLPNLVAGRTIVPELLQDDLTPRSLAARTLELLENPELRLEQRNAGLEVRRLLGGGGAGKRAAAAIAGLLDKRLGG